MQFDDIFSNYQYVIVFNHYQGVFTSTFYMMRAIEP